MAYKVGTGEREITIEDNELIENFIKDKGVTILPKSDFYGQESISATNEVMAIKRREFRDKRTATKS